MATVEAVEKTITLIEHLAEHPHGIGVVKLAERLGMASSTTHRYLMTLQKHGIVEQNEHKHYALTPRLYLFGLAVGAGFDLETQAEGSLRRLAEVSQETACLMVRDGRHAVCVGQIDSRHPLKITARLGSRQDLRVGATSRVLLAYAPDAVRDEILDQDPLPAYTPRTVTDPDALRTLLADIRRDGVYLSRGEIDEGVVAIAAPVWNRQKEVIAALVIVAPAIRLDTEGALERATDLVVHEAADLSERLGFVSPVRPLAERTTP